MRKINRIIIHCSASGQEVTAEQIRQWHLRRGWSDIGYHYVIEADGFIKHGRNLWRTGAHAQGHNRDSIGICWVGGYKGKRDITEQQETILRTLVQELQDEFDVKDENVIGHCDLPNVAKTCPNFDVQEWLNKWKDNGDTE